MLIAGLKPKPRSMRARTPLDILAVLSLTALAACVPRPIFIGFAGSLTGKNSDLGIDGREAVSRGADTALIARRLRTRGVTARILSSSWAETQETEIQGGAAAEGRLFPESFDAGSRSPAFLAFGKAFRERFGRDPTASATPSARA